MQRRFGPINQRAIDVCDLDCSFIASGVLEGSVLPQRQKHKFDPDLACCLCGLCHLLHGTVWVSSGFCAHTVPHTDDLRDCKLIGPCKLFIVCGGNAKLGQHKINVNS